MCVCVCVCVCVCDFPADNDNAAVPLTKALCGGVWVQYLNTKYGVDVPLILMNSFKTNEETIKIIRKYSLHNLTIHCFNQSCFPCVDGDHYSPMPTGPFTPESSNLWCVCVYVCARLCVFAFKCMCFVCMCACIC